MSAALPTLPSPPPHLERLLARLAELTSPVIQLWGWPGLGKHAVLEALVDRGGDEALSLALAETEDRETLRALLERSEVASKRWLVAFDLPQSALLTACRLLRPGQRLVCAGSRRLRGTDLPLSLLGPSELVLTDPEGRALGRDVLQAARRDPREPDGPVDVEGKPGGETETEADATAIEAWSRELHGLTGGWYTPMRIALRALARSQVSVVDPDRPEQLPTEQIPTEQILGLPALQTFFRHQVLEALPAPLRSALVARSARSDRSNGEASEGRETDPRLADYGWHPEATGGLALPELFAGFLQSLGTGEEDRDLQRASASEAGSGGTAEAAPQVRIALLGPAKVSVLGTGDPDRKGSEVPWKEIHWPLTRALKIVAYLASSEDFRAARADLTAALWPEDDEERIARNFHPTLSHLRRTFHEAWEELRDDPSPAPLLYVHGSYQLNPEIRWQVDLVELSSAAERGRELREVDPAAAVEGWNSAVSLYRGPFLSGVYDAWTDTPRERYLRRWLDLLRELADLYFELERYTDAVDAYRRILIEDPLREPVHQALMSVYSRQGRRDLVRRQYDRLAALLAEELGVEPLPQTTEEYHRLMG